MPTVTKTLTGPSIASKYPYRYQQDVKDRNEFRLRVRIHSMKFVIGIVCLMKLS